MNLPYFDIQTIDRTLYEYLRLELVNQGLMPDILSSSNYREDLKAIKSGGKTPVELYGVSSWNYKQIKDSLIVIERVRERNADTGFGLNVDFVRQSSGTKFDKNKLPISQKVIEYSITMVVTNTSNERIVRDVIKDTLGGSVKVLNSVDESGGLTQKCFVLYASDIINVPVEDYIEVQFRYETSELFLSQSELMSEVEEVKEFQFGTNQLKQLSNEYIESGFWNLGYTN